MNRPLKTFIIYARADEEHKRNLLLHLRPLTAGGLLAVWHDGDILPGEDWERAIKKELKTSELVLVLVSVHMLNSEFIQTEELRSALEGLDAGLTRVVPVVVSPCVWRFDPVIRRLQALPLAGAEGVRPITEWSNANLAWAGVVEHIGDMAEDVHAKRAAAAAAELAEKQRVAAEKLAREQAAAQNIEAEKQRLAAEKLASEQEAKRQAEAERKRLAAEKLAAEREAAQKIEVGKQRIAEEQAAREREISQQAERENLRREAAQRAENNRLRAEIEAREAAERRNFAPPNPPEAKPAKSRWLEWNPVAGIAFGSVLLLFVAFQVWKNGKRQEVAAPKNENPLSKPSAPADSMGEGVRAIHPSKLPENVGVKKQGPGTCENCPEMVFVQGGEFKMGINEYDDEKPVHTVALGSFYIGKYEITQAEWRAVMGSNPSENKGCDRCPVENVSWNDVQDFIKKLNQLSGKTFRLPTEAEWEFAARGGTGSKGFKFSGGNDLGKVAWYYENAGNKTHPVGQKAKNELEIHDMSGNVWEWCADWYDEKYYEKFRSSTAQNPTGPATGEYRVLRGGSWLNAVINYRPALRFWNLPSVRGFNVGFRLARH